MSNYKGAAISTLSDVITEVVAIADPKSTYWFRGHSNKEYKLLPSIFRPSKSNNESYYDESELLDELVRRFPKIRGEHTSTLELLTYAQHYGIPTRLLDWTENLLVALYFCCIGSKDTDAELHMLKANKIRKYKRSEISNIEDIILSSTEIEVYRHMISACEKYHKFFLSKLPPKINNKPYTEFIGKTDLEIYMDFSSKEHPPLVIDTGIPNIQTIDLFAYHAPMINSRLIAQKGCFTLHTGKMILGKEIVKIPHMEKYKVSDELCTLLIPSSSKERILSELNICGINKHTLFPEIDFQIENIKKSAQMTK